MLRRNFLIGLFTAITAPAIVRATSLMPINPGLIVPPRAIIQPRASIGGVPRCEHCFGPWGMCAHTGGPLNLGENPDRLDRRVVDAMVSPKRWDQISGFVRA